MYSRLLGCIYVAMNVFGNDMSMVILFLEMTDKGSDASTLVSSRIELTYL